MKRQKVSVHYVLKGAHKGKWSIVDRAPGSPTYNKVLTRQTRVVLHDADFRVSEKRRQWVIANVREVHARVWGLCDLSERRDPTGVSAHYNPHRSGTCTTRDAQGIDHPIHTAEIVVFHDNGRCYV